MKLKTLAGVAALVVVALSIGAMATASADTPNCITKSLDDDTCIWELELTKVEVKVEYEYPYCEVKLTVEHNLDELPEGARILHPRNVRVIYTPPGADNTNSSFDFTRGYGYHGYHAFREGGWLIIGEYNSGEYKTSLSKSARRYKHDELDKLQGLAQRFSGWQQVTLGKVYMQAHLEYGDEFKIPQRVGNAFTSHESKLPNWFRSDSIPLSHTFAGLTEEVFTCGEVAKREAARVVERSALDTEKAGLRQSLVLLNAELARARQHELNATTVLKEVIAISERVDDVRRTIQRLRVEGLAERRALVERYYAEESQRYSVFIKSLEAAEAALAASDKAIAAHKAELEASRARLDALVTAAQKAEAELIAEIERAEEALGEDED